MTRSATRLYATLTRLFPRIPHAPVACAFGMSSSTRFISRSRVHGSTTGAACGCRARGAVAITLAPFHSASILVGSVDDAPHRADLTSSPALSEDLAAAYRAFALRVGGSVSAHARTAACLSNACDCSDVPSHTCCYSRIDPVTDFCTVSCSACGSNGPFSYSQSKRSSDDRRCVSCVGGIFSTPTQLHKASYPASGCGRVGDRVVDNLHTVNLPLQAFIADAASFVDSVTGTFGGHLPDPGSGVLASNLLSEWEMAAYSAAAGDGSPLAAAQFTPRSLKQAMTKSDAVKEWLAATASEVQNMATHGAWTVIKAGSKNFPTDKSICIMGSQFVFKVKSDKKGRILKYKVRLVARGDTQVEGQNYDDTFSPVVALDTMRTFFAFATRRGQRVKQLDYEAAFLQARLTGDNPIYMRLPSQLYDYADELAKLGIGKDIIGERGDAVLLQRSIYGLKQAGMLWSQVVRKDLETVGFTRSAIDECLFIQRDEKTGFEMYLLLYVDDCIYCSNDEARAERVIDELEKQGRVLERMGEAEWFLGAAIKQDLTRGTTTISQPALAREVLRSNGLFGDVNDTQYPASAPCSAKSDIAGSQCADDPPDPRRHKCYRTCIGKLLYLARVSRPDIMFAVCQLGRFAKAPAELHFRELHHLLRYIKATIELGITYHRDHSPDFFIDSNSFGAPETFDLLLPHTWTDSDWAGEATSRVSVSGFAITFCGAVISYGSERQACISLSTTEAELVAMARAVQECIFVRKLVAEFMGPLKQPTFVFCDNKGALDLVKNNVHHRRTKHIDIKYFFARSKEADGTIITARVPTEHNLSDSFTKGVNSEVIRRHRFPLLGMDISRSGDVVLHRVDTSRRAREPSSTAPSSMSV